MAAVGASCTGQAHGQGAPSSAAGSGGLLRTTDGRGEATAASDDPAVTPIPWAARVGGSVGWTTEKVYRGIGQSDGKAALLVSVDVHGDSGWAVAAAASLIGSSRVGDVAVSIGRSFGLADGWSAQWSLEHDRYPGAPRRRAYDHDELAGSVLYDDRWQATVTVSPNTTVRGADGRVVRGWATAVQLGLHQRLLDRWALDLGIGRAASLAGGGGYVYGSAGVSTGVGPVQAFITRIVGPRSSGTSYGPSAGGGDRWTAAVMWTY